MTIGFLIGTACKRIRMNLFFLQNSWFSFTWSKLPLYTSTISNKTHVKINYLLKNNMFFQKIPIVLLLRNIRIICKPEKKKLPYQNKLNYYVIAKFWEIDIKHRNIQKGKINKKGIIIKNNCTISYNYKPTSKQSYEVANWTFNSINQQSLIINL